MTNALAAVLALIATTTMLGCAIDPAESTTEDALTGACTVGVTFPTACTTALGRDGWCEQLATGSDAGRCVEACRDPIHGGCPSGHTAVFIAGDQCVCEPNIPTLRTDANATEVEH